MADEPLIARERTEKHMVKSKCAECRDAATRDAVNQLRNMNREQSKEAFLLQYMILHKAEYIDEHELLMLMTGMFGEGWDLESVSRLVGDMRAKLVCELGVELIEHRPESGYTISRSCALLDECA